MKTSSLYGWPRLSNSFLIGSALLFAISSGSAQAADMTEEFDTRHKACLEKISEDADLAFEEAMIWQNDGGGRRARHCVAMALFAVGHKEEAAARLEELAKSPDGGSPAMRANFYLEATNFWLLANKPDEAYTSATSGLKVSESFHDLRIARARAYALMERYDYAETDLSSVLAFEPDHAAALRYRADARRKQGKLQLAKADIEASLKSDPESVETALVRGEINESIRLFEATKAQSDKQKPE